jgi:UDP:flavonoid glycosyltransferase YjiC (YdhE family)
LLAHVNGQRSRFGLSHVFSSNYEEPHVLKHLAAFPDWFCPLAADWPAGVENVGFPLPAAPGKLSRRIADFLEQYPRPVIFTPGTCVEHACAFAELARECCDELGRPGILLARDRGSAGHVARPSFLELDFVELALLLPHCSSIVHHGGIGTIARALEAGVPQVALPRGFDQFDNGERLRLLGVGSALDTKDHSAPRVARAVDAVLSNEVMQKATLLAHRVVDGVSRASDVLEAMATHERCSTFKSSRHAHVAGVGGSRG